MDKNKLCRCTRCKNVHIYSDRYEKISKNGMIDIVCPRCEGKTYYDVESEEDQIKRQLFEKINKIMEREVNVFLEDNDNKNEFLEDHNDIYFNLDYINQEVNYPVDSLLNVAIKEIISLRINDDNSKR